MFFSVRPVFDRDEGNRDPISRMGAWRNTCTQERKTNDTLGTVYSVGFYFGDNHDWNLFLYVC